MFFFSTGALIMLVGIAAYFFIYNENTSKGTSKDPEESAKLSEKSVGDDSVFAPRTLSFLEKLNLIKAEGSGFKQLIRSSAHISN